MRNFNTISNFLGANTLQFIGGGNSQNEVRKTEGEQPRNRQRISNLSLTLVSAFVRYAVCIALLLCLCVGQMWGEDELIIASSFNSTTGWDKGGCSAIEASPLEHRTGSKSLSSIYTGGTGEQSVKMSPTCTIPANVYMHIIAYAKMKSDCSQSLPNANVTAKANCYLGGNNSGDTVRLNKTTWRRFTMSKSKSSAQNSASAWIMRKANTKTDSVYIDDVIVYKSTKSTLDETAPNAPGSPSATASTISWTRSRDGGGASDSTGVQGTYIFKRIDGSSDDLSVNQNGVYVVGDKDNTGHWQVVEHVTSPATTSSTASLVEDTRYALVHRDLAYNMSSAAYVSTPAAAPAETSYTFPAGTTIYYDFTAISGGGNYSTSDFYNYSNYGTYDESLGGKLIAVTFASAKTIYTDQYVFKTGTGSWADVNFTVPSSGQNVIICGSDGKSFTWGTATFAIAGEMNEWSTSANISTTGSLDIDLDAHTTYKFKVVYKGGAEKYCGISDTRISSSVSDYNCTWGGGDDIYLMTAGAGTYTFAYDFANNQLDVTYPTVTHPSPDYCYLQNYSWSNTYLQLYATSDSHATKGWPGQQLYSPATTTIGGVSFFYFAMGSNYTSIQLDDNGGNYTGYQTPTYGQYLNYDDGWGWRKWSYTITLSNGGADTYPSNPSIEFCGTAPSSLTPPTKAGYTFGGYYNTSTCDDKQVIAANGGWNTSVAGFTDGSGKWIHEGGSATLYAKWTAKEYTISLDRQSGSGGPASVTATYNSSSNLTSITRPTRSGYTFAGYYTLAYGSGSQLIDKDGNFNSDVTDYITDGKWTKVGGVTLYAYWKHECSATAYTIRYYNSGTVAYESACFEQVGSTHEWNIEDFAIPSQTKYSVGYNEDVYASDLGTGATKSSSAEKSWTDTYSKSDDVGNGAMQLLPVGASARAVGQATGALGTLVIWDDSKDKNLSVGFLPNGYGVTTADATYAFTIGDSYFCYTDPVTISSTEAAGNFQVKLQTSSSYAACAQGTSENASAVSGRKITGDANIANGKKGVFQMWQNSTANNFGLRFVTVHDVSFDLQGHGDAIDDYTNVRYNDKIVAPSTPTATGYTFGGWYKEAGCTNEWDFASDVVTEATTLHAKWTIKTYTVSFVSNNDDYGTVDVSEITGVTHGSEVEIDGNVLTLNETDVTPTATTSTAAYTYAFSGWSVSDGAEITSAQTITAIFTRSANSYTLAWNTNGGSDLAGSPTSGSTAYGTTLTPPDDPTRDGYTFAGWNSADDGTGDDYTGTMPAANTTYYAQWEEISYCYEFAPSATSGSIARYEVITTSSGGIMEAATDNISYDSNGLLFSSSSGKYVQVALDHNMQVGTVIALKIYTGADTERGLSLRNSSGTAKGTYKYKATGDHDATYVVEADDGFAGSNILRIYRENNAYLKSLTVSNCSSTAATTYNVSHTLSHVSFSSGIDEGTGAAIAGGNYTAIFEPDDCYLLPATITVTIGGSSKTAGTDYYWTQATGTLVIPGKNVTGNISITISGTDNHSAAGLSYGTASVSKKTTDEAFTIELSNPNSLTVSYESDDEDVATVDDDGEVTIAGAGTCTITASADAQDCYNSGSAYYTLTVTACTTPTVNWSTTPANGIVGGSMTAAVTTNYSDGLAYSVTGATPSGCVTINGSTGAMSYVKPGTATVKATVTGDGTTYCEGPAEVSKAIKIHNPQVDDDTYAYYYSDATHFDGTNTYKNPEGNTPGGTDGDNTALTSSWTIRNSSFMDGLTSIVATNARYDNKSDHINAYIKLRSSDNGKIVFTIADNYTATIKIKMGGYSGTNTNLTMKLDDSGDNISYTGTMAGKAETEDSFAELTYSDLAAGAYTLKPTNGSLYISQIDIETTLLGYAITNGSPSGGTIAITDGSSAITSSAAGETVHIAATPSTGYGFTSWSVYKTGDAETTVALDDDDDLDNKTRTFTMPAYGVTVNATFTPITYTVTLNTNGGTINTGDVDDYTYGTGATLPTDVTKDGYRFMGWRDNSGLTGDPVEEIGTSETGNKEYWAKWAELYTITTGSHANGVIKITNSSSEVITEAIEGETVSIDATGGVHYGFGTWSLHKTGDESTTVSPAAATASTTFTMPAYGVTVNATFAKDAFTLSYDDGDATSGSAPTNPVAGDYAYGTVITVPDNNTLAKDEDAFVGWLYNNKTLYVAGQKFTMTEDVELTAVWNTACSGGGVLFEQDFGDATGVAYAVSTARAYTKASGLDNCVGDDDNLFTSLTVTSQSATGIAVNSKTGFGSTDASGVFQAKKGGNSAYWSITRTNDFAATAPTAISVAMDIWFHNTNSGAGNIGVDFAVGDDFTDGLNSSSSQTSTNVHSGFSILDNSASTLVEWNDGSKAIYNTAITQSTWLSVVWIINNTGSTLTYDDPDGSGTSTVNNDCFDIWLKTQAQGISYYTRVVAGQAAITGSKDLQNIHIGGHGGKQHEFQLDNVVVTNLTPGASSSGCKFDVTFDNMDGFAGSAVTTLPSGIEGVPANRKIAKPADPTTTGNYVFGGWFTDDACTEAWDFASDKVTEDVTLYAKWYDADYTITWKANGETYATTKACDAVTTIVLPTAPADNLLNGCANSFRGWSATNLYGEANDDQPADLFIDAAGAPTINADKTFYAVFGTATDAAYLGTVLWSEDWTDAANNSTPASLTAGGYAYPGSVISYSYTDGTGDNKATTKVATDNNAGGVVPELMVGYGTTTAGAFTITGLPNKGAKELTLIYKRNHSTTSALNPSVRGEGYSISKVSGTGADTYVYTITCGTASTFDLTLTGSTTKNNNVRVDDIILKVKTDGATDYRCICPSLTLVGPSADLVFVTSTAEKTVRSQEAFTVSGTGLTKNADLTTGNFGSSKFEFKTATGGAVTTDANGELEETEVYVFYTPAADDDEDGLDEATEVTISIEGAGEATSNNLYGTKRVIGRHLPANFVIAAKNGDKWYAMPATMSTGTTPTPVEIAVDDINNPSVAYTDDDNYYGLAGPTNSNISGGNGQYIRLTMHPLTDGTVSAGPAPLYASTTSNIGKNGTAGATSDLSAGWWWLLTQTNTSITNPEDAKYTIASPNNGNPLKLYKTSNKWGLYAYGSTVAINELRLIPAQSGVGFAEAEIVAWGKNSVIVEVDNSTMIAEYVKAKLPEDVESEKITLTQTRTSVKGTGTRYNYTVNFGEGVDFSANDGKMLTLEWYDILDNFKAVTNIMVPCIVASNITINKSNYSNKSDWNKEVHVLPGDTVTIDASGYSGKNITIKELVIYPGARVVVQKDTLITPTLVLRNGWNRLTAETEYNVAQMYITPTEGSLQATNAYADWYIDYDQYYPIAVPWKVATANIAYRNTSGEASEGVIVRYYDGERRAKGGAGNTNWKQYTWGYDMPTNLEPGIGYAITARRPAGKAFSIVRLPLTIPSNDWTTAGEQGEVSDTHKDQVAVTAWVKDEGETPEYAKGWNFVANPYMSVYEGEITFTPTSDPGVDYEEEITYVNIPDVNFKEFEQVAAETAELKPGCGFLIQTEYNGTITFGTSHRKASAPSYRTSTPRMPKQKAYILLSGEETVDQMGLIIADRYTENYEVNADLEKLLSDGNTLRTYMQYGNLNMAYVAINSMLAQVLIPVSVRIPAAGEYTYSLHYASRVSELEGIYLVDYMTNKVTNLMESDYTFTSEAGTITDRFAINAIEGQHETPTDIDVVQGGGDIQADHPIKFIYQEKVYIYHKGVIYDAMGKKVAERRAAL